jgi:hypothetical protein
MRQRPRRRFHLANAAANGSARISLPHGGIGIRLPTQKLDFCLVFFQKKVAHDLAGFAAVAVFERGVGLAARETPLPFSADSNRSLRKRNRSLHAPAPKFRILKIYRAETRPENFGLWHETFRFSSSGTGLLAAIFRKYRHFREYPISLARDRYGVSNSSPSQNHLHRDLDIGREADRTIMRSA